MNSREEKKHKCTVCEYASNDRSHLIRHERIHTGERPFICGQCNSAFGNKSDLLNHNRKHTGENPFKCDQCNYACAKNSVLLIHKRRHTGEKPYECDKCNFASAVKSDLVRHKRGHTGEKPYKCDQCNFTSTRSSHLIRHRRTHTGEKPYKCDQCNSYFSQNSYLTTHIRIHTGEKPFQCDQCNLAFARSSALLMHKRIHTGEKPYKCDQCGLEFARKDYLDKHKRKHSEYSTIIFSSNAISVKLRRLTRHEINSWNASFTSLQNKEVIEDEITHCREDDLNTNCVKFQEATRDIRFSSKSVDNSIVEHEDLPKVKVETDFPIEVREPLCQWTDLVSEIPTGITLPQRSNLDTEPSVQIESGTSFSSSQVLNSGNVSTIVTLSIKEEAMEAESIDLSTIVETWQEAMRDNNYILPNN